MKDLTNIPERFHCLFLTDWRNGEESEMGILQRNDLALLYLEYNKWDVQRMIDSKKIIVEDTIVGFEKI
jgi:hypothetical protein